MLKFRIQPSGIHYALLAAILFGITTPFAKLLTAQIAPQMLAGLLYMGSGLGLAIWLILKRRTNSHNRQAQLHSKDLPWLIGAIVFGGAVAPVLLMVGLTFTAASSASLLLNLEGVFTAVIAWFIFKEHFDRRIVFGMLLIVAGGILLSWQENALSTFTWQAAAIIGACFCWAIDNNLTRKISGGDAVQIACLKGLTAGAVNLCIALVLGNTFPHLTYMTTTLLLGFFGYGMSLVLFVLALRNLGAARTGAYFSVAPFVGLLIAILFLGESTTLLFWLATLCMAAGVWLHLSEYHAHMHTHEPLEHTNLHTHDEHHQHTHTIAWDGKTAHAHPHKHLPLMHSHPHFPDLHHLHQHED